jgi:CBS domain-containing protein
MITGIANSSVKKFWETNVDFENQYLDVDRSPFCVLKDTPLSKVHFLFTMLNISQLIVIERGRMVGIITKREFLRQKE